MSSFNLPTIVISNMHVRDFPDSVAIALMERDALRKTYRNNDVVGLEYVDLHMALLFASDPGYRHHRTGLKKHYRILHRRCLPRTRGLLELMRAHGCERGDVYTFVRLLCWPVDREGSARGRLFGCAGGA